MLSHVLAHVGEQPDGYDSDFTVIRRLSRRRSTGNGTERRAVDRFAGAGEANRETGDVGPAGHTTVDEVPCDGVGRYGYSAQSELRGGLDREVAGCGESVAGGQILGYACAAVPEDYVVVRDASADSLRG